MAYLQVLGNGLNVVQSQLFSELLKRGDPQIFRTEQSNCACGGRRGRTLRFFLEVNDSAVKVLGDAHEVGGYHSCCGIMQHPAQNGR
jgi:hypothetical protein